jgi:two-component sensor histidine kinase/ligand-binding sensor domain-containing protein
LKFVKILCFLFIVQLCNSQTIKGLDTLTVNILGQKEGLLQLNVKGLTLDDLGYLWAGTEDGLHRFNSYTFKPYLHNPSDSLSIKDDHIRDLLFTKDTLWIATNSKGVNGYLPSKNKFFHLNLDPDNEKLQRAYKLFKINSTFLIFGAQDHFILYNRKKKTYQTLKLPVYNTENTVNGVYVENSNTILLATNFGVLNYNIALNRIETNVSYNKEIYNSISKVNSSVFFGTEKGFMVKDLVNNTQIFHQLEGKVKAFHNLNNKTLLIGTSNGVYCYNTVNQDIKKVVFKTQNDVVFNKISVESFLNDNQGNLWIGTEGEGLLHYNEFQEKFKTLRLVLDGYSSSNKISSFQFLKDDFGSLYIGASSDLLKYNSNNNSFKQYHLKGEPLIYTITKDSNGTIWAGGFTSGLLKHNRVTDTFEEMKPQNHQLSDRDVIEILPLNKNELLVATWSGGLYRYIIQDNIFIPYLLNGLSINRARCSFKDSKSNIWLGTDDGVFKIQPDGSIKTYTDATKNFKLSSNRIFSITEDLNGAIWFGTSVGLTKLTENKTIFYFKQKGLPNEFIYSILVDKKNQLWVSTNFGLSVFNQDTNSFTNYTKNDGLQNNEFNGKAGYKDEQGLFYFGGIDGVNIFDPSKIIKNPHLPDVYIEQVDLFNSPLEKNELFLDKLSFKNDENVISFNFSALNFINPEKVNYSYRLVGFDKGWRSITKDKSTTYTNLDPGDYVFQVKATNDNGIWSKQIDTLSISIIPPWYKTLWFKIGLVLALILTLFLIYFLKTRQLKSDKLKLELLVNERTKEISEKQKALTDAYINSENQKENIKFLMRELRHRVKNNLQIISSLLNIQSFHLKDETAKDALKVAKNRILTISHLEDKMAANHESVNLKTFTEELCESIMITLSDENNINFSIIYKCQSLEVSGLNTTLFGLIINEIITNTVKHAFPEFNENNFLKIIVSDNLNSIFLETVDNGIGYTSLDIKNESLGLDLIQDMVSQLNGQIISTTTNGVKHSITIPKTTTA